MKKLLSILTLSLVTIVGGIGTVNPVSAQVVVPREELAFTVDELIPIERAFRQEFYDTCSEGEDWDCRWDLYYQKSSEDDLFRTAKKFIEQQFVITAFNPTEGTFKVFYHGGSDIPYENPLNYDNLSKELKMGWSEAGYSRPVEGGNTLPTDEASFPEGYHSIYFADLSTEELGWIQPDTEFLIHAEIPNFVSANDGYIQYRFSSNKSSSGGVIPIDSCFKSTNYQAGDECRIVFSLESSPFYVPYRDGKPVAPNYILGEEPDSTSENTTVEQPEVTDEDSVPEEPKNPTDYPTNSSETLDITTGDTANGGIDVNNNIVDASNDADGITNDAAIIGTEFQTADSFVSNKNAVATPAITMAATTSTPSVSRVTTTRYVSSQPAALTDETSTIASVNDEISESQSVETNSSEPYVTPLGGEVDNVSEVDTAHSVWWLIIPVTLCGMATFGSWLYFRKSKKGQNKQV